MKPQLLAFTVALTAAVGSASLVATAQSPARMTAKQAALKGLSSTTVARAEQRVSNMIVKLRGSSSDLVQPMSVSRVQALAATAGVGMKSVRAMAGGASLLSLDAAVPLSEARAIAARLMLNPAVEYAEPDYLLKKLATPTEVRFNEWQWNLFAPTSTYTGQDGPNPGTTKSATATGGANLPPAWDVTTGANSVVVAIIDTGIVNHTDLNGQAPGDTYIPAGRFLAGYDFISSNVGAASGLPANFVANDGNGRDNDASDPGDWVTTQEEMTYASACDDGQAGPQNSSWHGSHMAGVAAATANNSTGIAGIGWLVRILPVRALGKCGGALSDIAEAIRWAAGLPVPGVPNNTTPAQVINLSLGSPPTAPCDATMQSAVDAAIAAGAVVVAATGNDGDIQLSVPAKCNGVIAVTAHTINGENADYANIGPAGGGGPNPTISAPGGGSPVLLGAGGPTDDNDWFGFFIWSTILFGNQGPSSTDSSNPPRSGPAYAGSTGTSAATPQVAATAALIKSLLPNATPAQIRTYIVSNVRPHPTGGACTLAPPNGFLGQCGPGLLDANAAVQAAALVAAPVIGTEPQNVSVLEGQTATFSASAVPGPTISYQWQRNGTNISGATSSTYTTPPTSVAADNGSTYRVVATNSRGSATSASATLSVAPPPPPAPPGGSPPPSGGGGGGGGTVPLWQLLLLLSLGLATRVRISTNQR